LNKIKRHKIGRVLDHLVQVDAAPPACKRGREGERENEDKEG
jgi:hypothetical protein